MGSLAADIFQDLWQDRNAILERDHAAVVQSAEMGLKTADHAAFVDRLAAARAQPN
jgi:hypothetical protein